MKKATTSLLVILFTGTGLFLSNALVSGQEPSKEFPSLPDNINKIVTASCMPCHSSKGGIMARGKVNFSEWTQYTPSVQKEKAEKTYSVLKEEKMPPKSVRESRPDIIPTKDQIDTIKKWAESLDSDDK